MALTHSPTPLADQPPAAAEALFEEARRRRRRRRIGWLVIVVVCAALAASAAYAQASHRTTRPPTTARPPTAERPLPAGTPADIVGWLSSDQVVVIDTRTGAVVRTLATGVSVEAPGLPDLTVSPGGRVYFDSAPIAGVSPRDAEGDQIYSVPIIGGPVVEVGPGSDPQVSPNGQLLAYIASDGVGEAPYLFPGGGIDVATLAGDRVADVRTLHPDPAQEDQGASDLSWSPDGQRLSFDLLGSAADTTTSWTIAPAGAGSSLGTAQQIPLQSAGLTWNGYWRVGRTGVALGLGVLTSPSSGQPLAGTQRVVTIDPSTGGVVHRLFSVSGAVCTASAPPSVPSDCDADYSNALSVDGAGTSVLVGGAIPLSYGQVSTSGLTYLYRWSVGSTQAVRLTRDVLVASWGPPPARG
jgi:hypothetical protein